MTDGGLICCGLLALLKYGQAQKITWSAFSDGFKYMPQNC
jgi:hypothetical protein